MIYCDTYPHIRYPPQENWKWKWRTPHHKNAYEIRCHRYDSKIMKALLARCSEDGSNEF